MDRDTPPIVQPADIGLNLVRLEMFRTVVERGSFSRAAEELSLAQSTVSGHMRALGDLFGGPLFDRQRRGAQLTEIGQVAYDFAIAVLRDLTVLRARVRDLNGGIAGTVTFGASVVPATYVLPRLLTRFAATHREARLHLRMHPPAEIHEHVLRGHLAFGIVGNCWPLPPSLALQPLWIEPLILAARPDHPLAGRSTVVATDLVDEPFVEGGACTLADQELDRALVRAGLTPRRVVMEAGSSDGVREAVRQGIGVGMLFRRVAAADLAAGELIALRLQDLPMQEQFSLIHRPRHRFTPLAEQLIGFLRDELRQLSPVPAQIAAEGS
jgi:DNA-binding transcriptional LysR family regulator